MSNPAQSTSRNPLEQPWSLSGEEFARRVKAAKGVGQETNAKRHETSAEHKQLDAGLLTRIYNSAREETSALTGVIGRVESEIDERVKTLYGVG